MALKEIMITLFDNPTGKTLSVTPNHSTGGKRINFSFKGKTTQNSIKAYNDGLANIKDPKLRNFFEQHKTRFRSKVDGCNTNDLTCWLSKGYLSDGHGKGPTVPAIAFMAQSSASWLVWLQLGTDEYECELDKSGISDRQRDMNAVAAHRWRETVCEDSYDLSFMGEAR
tara:strand:+ start:1417 stop:1923 length:507 start_codon:yes stop_codon:yes gene_type:complete